MPEIDIESPSKRFEEHLAIGSNYRIILSGKYGIGKTYFLKYFFDKRKENYNSFILSPVNYVVSPNEDIFELIKADIIKNLFLTGKINLEKLPEDNTLQKISNFVEGKKAVLGKFLLNMLSKLSSTSPIPEETIQAVGKIYTDYKKHTNNKKQEDKTRSEELSEYWFDTVERIGSIYEHNYITKLIDTFLTELKENGKKKNVLIIDDLDRVDPEHIFRILNVLSAHNNQFDSENKFQFDHVIIVCDFENIKRIFFHKYGSGVDFEGYIDKFFSTDLFHYSNYDAIRSYVQITFNTVSENNELDFLLLVFEKLIDSEFLTIRSLLKHRFDISFKEFILFEVDSIPIDSRLEVFTIFRQRHYVNSNDLPILRFFKLMSFVFGSFESFWIALLSISKSKTHFKFKDCKNLVSFLSLQEHISLNRDVDLFFKKHFEEFHGDKRLAKIDWPRIKNQLGNFKINLKWIAGRKYESNVSYFEGAKAIDENENDFTHEQQNRTIKVSEIFATVQRIAIQCNKNGYFAKVGIIWNPKD